MKLYYAPGACSLGIRVVMEELGVPYETQTLVSLKDGEQRQPAYLAVNPKAKIPTLERDDGSRLTEWPAIATWLARTNPQAGLIPQDPDAEARALEAIDYIVSTMHMQGFARMVRPENFGPSPADHDAVKARGLEVFSNGFALIDHALEGREYLAGPYSIADAALFFVCNWANRVKVALPPNVAAHFARMQQRRRYSGRWPPKASCSEHAAAGGVLVSPSRRDGLERAGPVPGEHRHPAERDRHRAGEGRRRCCCEGGGSRRSSARRCRARRTRRMRPARRSACR